MKNWKKNLGRAFTMTVLVLLTSLVALAQTVVTGKVTNSRTGAGVAGVSVTVKGTNVSTQTAEDGTYRISVPNANSVLVFTSIGYATQEVRASNASVVSFVEAQRTMEDVVVVAYGTRRKTDLTGSVTAVTAKDFQKGNIASSEQLLMGKVAGLQVTTGGGAAGGGSLIRVRGTSSLNASNDPLIVIDGVPVEGNGMTGASNLLSTLNPNDIESMSVLKDASATALYGSRATNGVIIITTKKGTSNKPTFNFNTKLSYAKVYDKVKVLTGDQIREIVKGTGNSTYIAFLGTENTDWQDQIYQGAMGIDNNLSIAGRQAISKNFRLPYRLSFGYLTQEGVLKTNKFNRLSAAFNLSPKLLNDHLTFNINGKFAKTKNWIADEGAIGSAVNFDPTQPVMSGNSKFGGYWEWVGANGLPKDLAARNPLSLLESRNHTSDVNRFIGNIQLDYKMHFLPDLHLLVNLGMDKIVSDELNVLDSTAGSNSVTNGKLLGSSSQSGQTKTSKLADIQLFYQKDFGKGNKFDLLLGHGYQEFMTDTKYYLSYYQNGTVQANSKVDDAVVTNGVAIESYLSRMNLTLSDLYLFTASLRRDASSRFAPNKRVGYFPAFAFAWKLKQQFFENNKVVTDIKLRFGWGKTGQQDGLPLNYYQPLYYRSGSGAQYNFGGIYSQFYRPEPYNPNLTWEETATSNIGLDFGFLNNRISGTVDVYRKKTTKLLSKINVAPGANFESLMWFNIGSLKNEGIELSLNTLPYKQNKITWDLGFNVTYNKAVVTSLYNQDAPGFKGLPTSGISGGTGNNIGIIAVGYAPNTFYPYKQIYGPDGKPIEGLTEDINRDGDSKDNYYYKKPAPDYLLGFSTGVTIDKFSVGIAGHGMIGNYLYNNFNSNNAVLRNILNPVLHVGNAGINYLDTRFTNNQYSSDYYIENASFFKLDNLNLGYNFGKIANNKAVLRLNASIQNILTITKYSGADPENSNPSGVDNNIYPRPRTFSLGANIDF